MAKQKKMIKVTLEVEPPYTSFAVMTFGGGAGNKIAVTSMPMELKDRSVIHVGEHGGIEQMTGNEAKRRKKGLEEDSNE